MPEDFKKAYVVAVDMGYGHQRAAFPLASITTTPAEWNTKNLTVISADNYPGIPRIDKIKWAITRKFYEQVSRLNGIPILGKRLFAVMNYLERIEQFYPKRDLSKPIFQTKWIYAMIHGGLGRHLIQTLNKNPLPLVTSFFITGLFAEEHGYLGDIYCLCTDTDISRVWAPYTPKTSRITYLAPTSRVRERLLEYGVRPEKIITTGFPLPKEILGGEASLDVCREILARRIIKLDPKRRYQEKHWKMLAMYLEGYKNNPKSDSPVTITFAVGGAGAQSDIGIKVMNSLKEDIKADRVRLNLVAGTSEKVLNKYEKAVKKSEILNFNDKGVKIIFSVDKPTYFKEFNKIIITTDVLWTKPSELSFYVGSGLPIIIAPPLGAQEDSNKAWLHMVGAGFEQENPLYTNEWFFDRLDSGWFAEAAMNGFIDAPKRGTYHVEDLVLRNKKSEIEDVHFL